MSKNTKPIELQSLFEKSGLQSLFIEGLGWSAPQINSVVSSLNGGNVVAKPVSSLKGYNVFSVEINERPTRSFMREVDSEISKLSPERLEIFQTPKSWFWHWPKRTNAGTTAFESIETLPNKLPLFLAQRLSGIAFTAVDHSAGLTIADVRNRVYGSFDASNVTKKFYDRFQKEHIGLSQAIRGIPDEDKSDYSTTLLNRLMFLYFLQKKQFLNDDLDYLENTLQSVQKLEGKDRYYSFYRDALLPLFFEKLNDKSGVIADPEIVSIIGDVPYVNGGLFGRNELEEEFFEELSVPDEAFQKIFQFFSEFNWHLDTRPTGNPNEINPEVIGYIFEQYINFTASGKKANGAYYTPHDVTAYMINQTLVPRIFDGFEQKDKAFQLLAANPNRYIQPMMLHGWDMEVSDWIPAPAALVNTWLDDPIHWSALDAAEIEDDVCLPGETWVEMFHRRERVASLRARITENQLSTVNDLITDNINSQLLLTDVIDELDSGSQIVQLFDQVTHLTVFDPTCGSGAFLFAALEVLEDIYAHIIDVARSADDETCAQLVSLVDEQPSTSYFIRKHCAIRNLYGTDLMPGAIETAKLRIFLALASCIDSRSQLQPLPDLDFNLKAGNLVVGFKDAADIDRFGSDFVAQLHLEGLQPQIDKYSDLYDEFVMTVESDGENQARLKSNLISVGVDLKQECDQVYAQVSGIMPEEYKGWVETARPFHWFCEFPEIIRNGGFDVIIGNPPYLRMNLLPGYSVSGYKTQKTPDLFAVCFERSIQLLSDSGRHAFIVMLSLSFGNKFSPLRGIFSERHFSEWWSTYGIFPAGLFSSNADIRNTVLILGPGGEQHVARHHIFTAKSRSHLFTNLEYFPMSRPEDAAPIRGGLASRVVEKILALPALSGPVGTERIFVKPTATYWFPVIPAATPSFDASMNQIEVVDGRLKQVLLFAEEDKQIAVAALAGKVSFLAWSALGDNFDVSPNETIALRKAAIHAAKNSVTLKQKAVKIWGLIPEAFILVFHLGVRANIRWTKLSNYTDSFDFEILSALGLSDHWRNLNIWYRQTMRSSGDSAKDRPVTLEKARELLGKEF